MNEMQRRADLEHLANVNHALQFVGNATVERPFNLGSRSVKRGEVLTRDELLQIPRANLTALAANHFINLSLDPAAYRQTTKGRTDAV
jgi:hypothetical protein